MKARVIGIDSKEVKALLSKIKRNPEKYIDLCLKKDIENKNFSNEFNKSNPVDEREPLTREKIADVLDNEKKMLNIIYKAFHSLSLFGGVEEDAIAGSIFTEIMFGEYNIVKQTCKKFNLTYKQLSEVIGVSESSLRSAVSNNKISNQVEKAINLYIENMQLKEKLEKSEKIKDTIKEWLK